jgi:spectinomycin phosphotransferase
MLERPPISDKRIASAMKTIYGMATSQATFLPLGYDLNTAIFQVEGRDGTAFFLKLRQGAFNPITVRVPQFLRSIGIKGIIPILNTREGTSWGQLDQYAIILYPFIPGKDGYQVILSDQQWIELGKTFKMIHGAQVAADLAQQIPQETFDPQWRETVRRFMAMVKHETFHDPVAQKLSAFMHSKEDVIGEMVRRADALAESLQQHPRDFVLCHADAHPGNYHITDTGEVYLVDWDNPTFAPRERDLMCFGAGMSGDRPGGREEKLFYQGYGNVEIDWEVLTYYRYERIIQDIAEFGKQLLLTTEGGEDREQSYQYFTGSFSPGEVVEVAFLTDRQHLRR